MGSAPAQRSAWRSSRLRLRRSGRRRLRDLGLHPGRDPHCRVDLRFGLERHVPVSRRAWRRSTAPCSPGTAPPARSTPQSGSPPRRRAPPSGSSPGPTHATITRGGFVVVYPMGIALYKATTFGEKMESTFRSSAATCCTQDGEQVVLVGEGEPDGIDVEAASRNRLVPSRPPKRRCSCSAICSCSRVIAPCWSSNSPRRIAGQPYHASRQPSDIPRMGPPKRRLLRAPAALVLPSNVSCPVALPAPSGNDPCRGHEPQLRGGQGAQGPDPRLST